MDILFTEIVQAPSIGFIFGMIVIIIMGAFTIGGIIENEKSENNNTVFGCIIISLFIFFAAFGIFKEVENPTGRETEYLYVATDSMDAEDFMKYDVVKAYDGILILTEKPEK